MDNVVPLGKTDIIVVYRNDHKLDIKLNLDIRRSAQAQYAVIYQQQGVEGKNSMMDVTY
jgi:hypothetical protein